MLETVMRANTAKIILMGLNTDVKNKALCAMAKAIEDNKDQIYKANKKDLEEALSLVETGEISKATYGRLKLDENKMRDMIQGIYDVIKLDDPSNKIIWERQLDEGLILTKVSSPIGVIGIIFEARPDVISQISSLAIKSGNAVILKGGKESNNTNKAIFEIIQNALKTVPEFPTDAVSLVYSREDVAKMLGLNGYIDLIIPRGSNELVKYIQQNTRIPVLGHASGICHIFIDAEAKKDMVNKIVLDSKVQYPTACNSVETILVHKDYPYYKELIDTLTDAEVEVTENPERYDIEYSDKKVAVKKVEDVNEAIKHINMFGSHHTDTILTENKEIAEAFMNYVDSAGVFHNVSTRFSDGFRYGFGAEVGISTNKTHARGPVGLEGLCIYKYKLKGNGELVDDYASGRKKFNHKNL